MLQHIWYLCLVGILLASSAAVDWTLLKQELSGTEAASAARELAENWPARPAGLFHGLDEVSLDLVFSALSTNQIWDITKQELNDNPNSAKVLLERLSKVTDVHSAPHAFRQAVYDQVLQEAQKAGKPIGNVPAGWMVLDGPEVMKKLVSLTPPRLDLFGEQALVALLQSHKEVCQFLTLEALQSLTGCPSLTIESECFATIRGPKCKLVSV